MSFIDIKDPSKRDKIVKDYISTIHRIQKRNENQKALGLEQRADLEQTFDPIIKATEKSTEEIVKKLEEPKKVFQQKIITTRRNPLDYYFNLDKKKIDRYYGMNREPDGTLNIGGKRIDVDDDYNIIIEDVKYNGTPGLWSMIMLARPQTDSYSDDDAEEYYKLATQINLIDNPQNITESSRPEATKKRKILEEIQNKQPTIQEKKRKLDGDEYSSGSGVQMVFLPGDIKGLTTKLKLLLAEFHAGNKSSSMRNEIVSILDELKRRKRISKENYTDINDYLSSSLLL